MQTFGNIDLPVRCTGTASGARQTGATLAEQIEDEVARLYQRIRASEKKLLQAYYADALPLETLKTKQKPAPRIHHDAGLSVDSMVGVKGLKPSTSRSQTARAINCATPR